MRSVAELEDVPDPALPVLQSWVADAPGEVTVLPVDETRGRSVLHRLQVTTHSLMGALARHTGGILLDRGWLRILGGGSEHLTDLATANGLTDASDGRLPGRLVVGHDVLGGTFAVNGGDLDCAPGEVAYFGPDTLTWAPLGVGHSELVSWALSGAHDDLYASLRWPGWEAEVGALRTDEGLAVYPFLFTTEGRHIERTSRRAVPIDELVRSHHDLAEQLRAE